MMTNRTVCPHEQVNISRRVQTHEQRLTDGCEHMGKWMRSHEQRLGGGYGYMGKDQQLGVAIRVTICKCVWSQERGVGRGMYSHIRTRISYPV